MTFSLSLNTAPLAHRCADPSELVETVARDLAVRQVQLGAEVLDPSWPGPILRRLTRRMYVSLGQTEVRVTSGRVGDLTQRVHFGHADKELRRYSLEWYKTFASVVADLGGQGVGGPLAVLTPAEQSAPSVSAARIVAAMDCWAELAEHAKSVGLRYLFWSPSVFERGTAKGPSEDPEVQAQIGAADMALPFWRMTEIDQRDLVAEPDPYGALRGAGAAAPIIQVRQVISPDAGDQERPRDHNAQSPIDPAPFLAALRAEGGQDNEICLDLSLGARGVSDGAVIPCLAQTAATWAPHLEQV